MEFIKVRCTQCGGEIKLDTAKEAGRCEYCGTTLVTEKSIGSYSNSAAIGDINNLVALAQNALWAGRPKDAYEYADKALAIDKEISQAWKVKLNATQDLIDYNNCIGNPSLELINYGCNVIRYLDGIKLSDCGGLAEEQFPEVDKEIESVYTTYLLVAQRLLNEAVFKIDDTLDMFNTITQGEDKELIALEDQSKRDEAEALTIYAVTLKEEIPQWYIKKHPVMQSITETLVEAYISYCQGDECRLQLYDKGITDIVKVRRQEKLEIFAKGLQGDKEKCSKE